MKNIDVASIITELQQAQTHGEMIELSRIAIAIHKGKLLKQLKDILPHGEFLPALEANGIKVNERTAQRMMKLADNEELIRSKTTNMSDLTLEKALKLVKKETGKKKSIAVPVATYQINTVFDCQVQQYQITINIDASNINLMNAAVNQRRLTTKVKEVLKLIAAEKPLTDLSNIVLN